MFSDFIALFDACVLYQAPVRDLVIELGLADLYRAKWTNRIHDEWINSLMRNRPEIPLQRLEKTRQLINEPRPKGRGMIWEKFRTSPKCGFEKPGPKEPGFLSPDESIEDCLVERYESLADILILPDSNDRHVLATAIKTHAQIIVTYNLKDFPAKYLDSFGIEAQHPDTFFLNQSDLQNIPTM